MPFEEATLNQDHLRAHFPSEEKDLQPFIRSILDRVAEQIDVKNLTPISDKELFVCDRERKRCDIACEDENGNRVIIEIQFGNLDESHTERANIYNGNLQGKIIVWICEGITPLLANYLIHENNHSSIKRYVLKATAIRLDDSRPHILLNALIKPQEQAPEVRARPVGGNEDRYRSDILKWILENDDVQDIELKIDETEISKRIATKTYISGVGTDNGETRVGFVIYGDRANDEDGCQKYVALLQAQFPEMEIQNQLMNPNEPYRQVRVYYNGANTTEAKARWLASNLRGLMEKLNA